MRPHLVTIVGGLGNQLFQYSFGQHVAAATGRPVRYDLALLDHYTTHAGGLAIERVFDTTVAAASVADLDARPLAALGRQRLRIATRFPGWLSGVVTDRGLAAQPLQPFSPPRFFHGYWQRPEFAAAGMAALRFRPEVAAAAAAIIAARGLDRDRDVAVHVRRRDYLTLPRACHLPLPIETYYVPLMASLAGPRRRFVILSDDIEPLKTTAIARFDPVFVDRGERSSAAIDLCLLSSFRTTIMSASSYSWWAAALNRHADAVTLYPDPWVKLRFADDPFLTPSPLPGWIRTDTRAVQAGGTLRPPEM